MTGAVYGYLFRTFSKKPVLWLGLCAEIVRTVLLKLLSGILLAQIVNSLDRNQIPLAIQKIWWLFGISLLGVSVGTLGALLAVRTENKMYSQLAARFYQKLTSKDMSFYSNNQSGYLTVVFRQYLDTTFQLLRLIRSEAPRMATTVFGPVAILSILNWRLGVATLLIVVVQLIYLRWSSLVTNRYRAVLATAYQGLSGMVGDHITNIVALRASGRQDRMAAKVAKLIQQENSAYWERAKVPLLLDWPRSLMTMAGIGIIVYIVLSGHSPHIRLVSLSVLTVTYLFQLLYSFESLPGLLVTHDNAVTKIHSTLQYLSNVDESVKDPLKFHAVEIERGEIELHGICFGYDRGYKPLFNGLSLRINPGERIGIVGYSGAGKTTLVHLLLRFTDVTAGTITIDGINIRDMAQDDLHRHMAYIPQEPLLFHGTIRDNITCFNDEITQAAIVRAARAAYAEDFIKQLPEGYDTMVGERGIKLSGGQRQRIAIARVILKDAPILLFDEATSALDSESEEIIQRAMPEIIGRRTAIVIAHRLSTVARLDRILVMHAGVIAEEGTHTQLLDRKGMYYALWQKQIFS